MSYMLNPLGATRTTDDATPLPSQCVASLEAEVRETITRLRELANELESIAKDLLRRVESLRTHIPR